LNRLTQFLNYDAHFGLVWIALDQDARPSDRKQQINPVDYFGRMISPLVLVAVQQIARRAIYHAEKLFTYTPSRQLF